MDPTSRTSEDANLVNYVELDGHRSEVQETVSGDPSALAYDIIKSNEREELRRVYADAQQCDRGEKCFSGLKRAIIGADLLSNIAPIPTLGKVRLGLALARSAIAIRVGSRALATRPNEAVFWTGLGRKGAAMAAQWAKQNGGVTLEATIARAGLVEPASIRGWEKASLAFARGAQGDVRVLQAGSVRTQSIWRKEYAALKRNRSVSSITAVDVRTGAETKLWSR